MKVRLYRNGEYLASGRGVDFDLFPFSTLLMKQAALELEWEAVAQSYLDKPLEEITEERYFEMLECLPPLDWQMLGKLERFNLMEMTVGSVTGSFVRYRTDSGHRYFTRQVDRIKSDTFITAEEIEAFINA